MNQDVKKFVWAVVQLFSIVWLLFECYQLRKDNENLREQNRDLRDQIYERERRI